MTLTVVVFIGLAYVQSLEHKAMAEKDSFLWPSGWPNNQGLTFNRSNAKGIPLYTR